MHSGNIDDLLNRRTTAIDERSVTLSYQKVSLRLIYSSSEDEEEYED